MSILSKLWRACREDGVRVTARRIGRAIHDRIGHVVIRKRAGDRGAREEFPDIRFRRAVPEDIPWLQKEMGHASSAVLDEQFRVGDVTLVGVDVEDEKVMLCQMSISRADMGLDLLGEHRAPDDVCFRRLIVPERARRRGIASRAEMLAEQWAWQDGARFIWGFIHDENAPSRRLHEKLDYVECGRIDLVTWFGRKYAKVRMDGDRRTRSVRLPNEVSKL